MRRGISLNVNTALLTLILGIVTWTLTSVIQLRESVVGLQRDHSAIVERANTLAEDQRELRGRVYDLEGRR